MKDKTLQILQKGISSKEWPEQISKSDRNYLQTLVQQLFQDKNKINCV
jgi:hypothetical protein